MSEPTIANILRVVRFCWGREVAEALSGRIRDGLMWAPESFPAMERRTREITEQWIAQSDLEFKPGPIHGPEDVVVRLEPGSKFPF